MGAVGRGMQRRESRLENCTSRSSSRLCGLLLTMELRLGISATGRMRLRVQSINSQHLKAFRASFQMRSRIYTQLSPIYQFQSDSNDLPEFNHPEELLAGCTLF